MQKKLNFNAFEKYLTNNSRFLESDPLYNKVYVLNAALFVMAVVCLCLVIIDGFFFKRYDLAAINAVCIFFAFISQIYFKKTNNYNFIAYATIVIMIFAMTVFFILVENQHYAFYWISIVPPLMLFLLGNKRGSIAISLYAIGMLLFFVYNRNNWEASLFDSSAIINIASATLILSFIIGYFEKSRKEVWKEIKKSNKILENNKNELKAIFNTTAEGIFGIDMHGKCIFCNRQCLEMLGYDRDSELIGKNLFELVCGKEKSDIDLNGMQCNACKTILSGEKLCRQEEVFRRLDGTHFDVEIFSNPMYKENQIVGAVVSFLDISERKKNEERLQYLCQHDSLTGLINRQRLVAEMEYFDEEEYLPLSIIYCDLNGLKLANDIFGHEEGDKLIREVADSLAAICRKNDIVARIGGDEFVWLLPNTDAQAAVKIMDRVKFRLMWNNSSILKCSMAMGAATRDNMNKSISQILKNAENEMYLEKSAVRNEYEQETLENMIQRLHESNPYDKSHSENVSQLSEKMGIALRWTQDRIKNLKDAGYYHDIGKIILIQDAYKNGFSEPFKDKVKLNQHPIIGFRIMNLFSNTQDIANAIYFHHERWDGTGYPKGLKGEEIPINSRIIAIAEQYDHYVNPLTSNPYSKEKALMEIQLSSGTKFDPMLTELFVLTNGRPAGVVSGINFSGRLSE